MREEEETRVCVCFSLLISPSPSPSLSLSLSLPFLTAAFIAHCVKVMPPFSRRIGLAAWTFLSPLHCCLPVHPLFHTFDNCCRPRPPAINLSHRLLLTALSVALRLFPHLSLSLSRSLLFTITHSLTHRRHCLSPLATQRLVGDSVLLQRGAQWVDETLSLAFASGVTVGAYGNGSLPRPSILHSLPALNTPTSCVRVYNAGNITFRDLHLAG